MPFCATLKEFELYHFRSQEFIFSKKFIIVFIELLRWAEHVTRVGEIVYATEL